MLGPYSCLYGFIAGNSSSAHPTAPELSAGMENPAANVLLTVSASSVPCVRSARGNALRRSAESTQSDRECTYAPRPGNVDSLSITRHPSMATSRTRSVLVTRSRHPTHVLTGWCPSSAAEFLRSAVECPTGVLRTEGKSTPRAPRWSLTGRLGAVRRLRIWG